MHDRDTKFTVQLEYLGHYHAERNHQGLDNELIDSVLVGRVSIVCDERLGGLLKYYRRAA